jgi:hypothetical protein
VLQTPGITLNSSWAGFTAEGLRRTLMHEIGHLLGLEDYATPCNVSDAIMQPGFTCTDSGIMNAITINDRLPVAKSTYGGGTRLICGF